MSPPLILIAAHPADEAEQVQLLTHLQALSQAGHIALWTADSLPPGADRRAGIGAAIEQAKVAILLLSANFLTGDELLPQLLNQHAKSKLTLVPVLAKACPWTAVVGLTKLDIFPNDRRPIWDGTVGRVDEQLTRLVGHLVGMLGVAVEDVLPAEPGPAEAGGGGKLGGVSFSGISNSTIKVGHIDASVKAGRDIMGGNKVSQTAGDYNTQAGHAGTATVNAGTFDQRRQQFRGDQYNAARDIHVHQPPPVPIPSTQRASFAVAGLLLGIGVNIAVNLLSAAIQARYFSQQFSTQSIWVLVVFAIVGSLLGLWLSGPVVVPAPSSPAQPQPSSGRPKRVAITRLQALLSYAKLRGQGIYLSDILLIGSKLDIDVEE